MESLSELEYRKLKSAVTRYIVKNSGNSADAEDFLNDTLLRFYTGELKYQHGNLGGFICTCVQRRWIDHLRKKKTTRTVSSESVSLEPKMDETIDYEENIDYDHFLRHADWKDDSTAVIAALWQNTALVRRYKAYRSWNDTPCKQRLEQVYVQGFSNQQVARLENVSDTTLNQRLRRCRISFIELFQAQFGISK